MSHAEYKAPAIPAWDGARALAALNVEEIPFEMINGNCQGYAKGRQIARPKVTAKTFESPSGLPYPQQNTA